MRGEVNRRRKGRDAINWDSKPEEFEAFEKRSLYATGFIQGVEFGVNVLDALPQQYANVEQEIKKVSAQIKAAKKNR